MSRPRVPYVVLLVFFSSYWVRLVVTALLTRSLIYCLEGYTLSIVSPLLRRIQLQYPIILLFSLRDILVTTPLPVYYKRGIYCYLGSVVKSHVLYFPPFSLNRSALLSYSCGG
jgi:hypothetical protein